MIKKNIRIKTSVLGWLLPCLFGFQGIAAAAEFEIVDKLSSNGYAVFKASAEVRGLLGISTGIPHAALDVVSTGTTHAEISQIWRAGDGVIKASMSATGVMMAEKFIGDGSGLANLPVGAGDNLGNHIATTTLNMNSWNMVGISSVNFRSNVFITSATAAQHGGVYVSTNLFVAGISSATRYYGDGSALTGVSTDTLRIGDSYGGGIVFWVDAKSKQALISATEDQSGSIPWAPTTGFTGAGLDGVGAGKADTVMITTTTGPGTYAARLCADYAATVSGVYYDDWYLPSSAELQLLYAQRTAVGGFTANWYWSSTEYVSDTTFAWTFYFGGGTVVLGTKTNPLYARCVRGGPVSAFDYLRNAETVRNGAYITSTQTFTGANTFYLGVTASSFTARGIGFSGAQLKLADNVLVSSETSPDLGGGVRVSTNMYIVGFASATKFYGDGSELTGISASGAGDDLGNHIATTTLNMAGFNISGVSTVTAAGYVDAARYLINKSTVMAILPGYKSFAIGINAGILNGTNADYNLFVGEQAGESNVTGDDNAFFGYKAGYLNTASDNTFIGYEVGYYNSSGFSNVFVGHQAGFSNETGSDNTFVGKYAGGNGYNGSHSSLFGSNAGYANSGDNNSFVGSSAGHDNTTGANNSILGYQAGSENRTGSANSIFGAQAGYGVSANSYSSSTLVGYKAGFAVTTGSDNLLLGFQSGDSLTTGSRNIIIGYDEDAPAATSNDYLNIGGIVVGDMAASSVTVLGDLYANHFYGDISGASGLPSGDNLGDHVATMTITANYGIAASTVNVSGYYQINGSTVLALPGVETLALGPNAGRNNTGTYNVFVGSAAGYSATIGWENSFLGSYAGYTTADGDKNVGIGAYAGYANNSNENVFIGAYSGYNNIAPWNTFVGAYSGYANTSGSENVFIGNYAGDTNTTGNNNTFIGAWAGDDNTTGGQNVFMGYEAGYNNTTGVNNTVLGYRSGNKTQTGAANAIYGAEAGLGFTGTSFSSSTLMGYQAGYALRTGSDNIFLGYKAGYTVTTGTGNIVIGYEKTTPAAGTNNHLNIGGILYGDLSAKTIGISTRAPQAALDVVSTGTASNVYAQLWRNSSGVVVASMTSQGALYAAVNAKVQAADTGITLTSADFGKTITVNSGSAQIINLPDITAADIGATITVVKLGPGRVAIDAPVGAYIADSASGGTIYNNAVSPAYAVLTLRVVTSTMWMPINGYSSWITTN